jgi:hypothetical protein
LDRLAGHFEWVRQAVELPDGRVRFLGGSSDKSLSRTAVVAGVVADHDLVFDRLRGLLEGTRKPDAGLLVHRGSVWIKPAKFLDSLATSQLTERYDANRLKRALAPFRGASNALRTGEGVTRAWEVDAGRLAEAMGLDPVKVERVLLAH